MIRAEFTFQEDRDMGGFGWMIKNAPDGINVCTEGRLVAHDVLEHTDLAQEGNLEGEVKAYGAIIYGRHSQGFLQPYRRSAEEVLGDEIADFVISGWGKPDECPIGSPPGVIPDVDEEFEEAINTIARHAGRYIAENLESRICSIDEHMNPRQVALARRHIRQWLKVGCAAVPVRLPGISSFGFVNLFANLQSKIDDLDETKDAGTGAAEHHVGTTMVVEVNPESHEIRVTVDRPEDHFYDEEESEEEHA